MQTVRSKSRTIWITVVAIAVIVFLAAIIYPIFHRERAAQFLSSSDAMDGGDSVSMSLKSIRSRPAEYSSDFDARTAPAENQAGTWASAYAASARRMVIKTGALSMEVSDVQKAHTQIERIASQAGGFVTESSLSGESGQETGSVTIRVPAGRYQTTLDQISKLGKVLTRSESGEDVTEEYVDLQSRIRNLTREEQAFLVVLGKARRIPDILAVERELSRVRGEIEQATGRLKYLENRVALSTITVHLNAPAPVVTSSVVWNVSQTAKRAFNALQIVFRKLLSLAIWLAIFIPLWAVLGLAVYGVRRWRRASKARS